MTTTTGPMGEVIRDGERTGLRYVRTLRHSPEKVWRALTEPDGLRHWFPTDIVGERVPGARLSLPFWPEGLELASTTEAIEEMGVDPDNHVSEGELRVWDPPRTFEFTWGMDGRTDLTDLLRFDLEPTDDGTRLTFTTWLGGPAGNTDTAVGWHVCLDQLTGLLDTPGSPTEDAAAVVVERVMAQADELRPAYAALISS
ncbi:SRPBCC domain-containing protein [Nocardioides sp. NPDC051685]|uniref:SRPBCC domain-containing protein n=1 Tax=Nocardioides sp. NPDC051685 TaxID=3364334 RepID=UPI0037B844E4